MSTDWPAVDCSGVTEATLKEVALVLMEETMLATAAESCPGFEAGTKDPPPASAACCSMGTAFGRLSVPKPSV
jgi:hypothetical protein